MADAGTANAGLQQALVWFRKRPMIPLLVAGAAVVAIIAALLLWAGGPDYRVLYSNLDSGDGGKIISSLEQSNIPYRLVQGGHTVMVPASKVYRLRLQLAQKGLPQSGHVGLDIMSKEPFGISQFAEHVNYQRGLQGELASSIEALRPVERARVHLALPKDSVFVSERKPAKATVVLKLHAGRTLTRGQVAAIVHIVSSSVTNLSAENVSVVDQNGHLLTAAHEIAGLDGSKLGYKRKVEQRYRKRIESILAPIVGAGNVRARVTANIDFRQREQTAEHYAPNQGDQPAAVRSHQSSSSWSNSDQTISGVPGALTNTPPGEAASPIVKSKKTQTGNKNNPKHDRLRRQDTTNYELDHQITHTQYTPGSVQRLSVAVVVNYRAQKQKDGSIKQVPLSKQAIQQIEALTRQAMGFSKQRGDSLTVVNAAFTDTAAATTDTAPSRTIHWVPLITQLGRYVLILIVIYLLYRLVLKPLRERYLQQGNADVPAIRSRANIHAQALGDDSPDEAREEEPEDEPRPRPRRHRAKVYENSMQTLRDKTEEDPALVAMIIRSWMKQDEQS